MPNKQLTLIERKIRLYNRLSFEIKEGKTIYTFKDYVNFAERQIRIHRETQKLLDDIFEGEEEDQQTKSRAMSGKGGKEVE